MVWRKTWEIAAAHRELVLAAAFVGMTGWELIEIVMLEAPLGAVRPVALGLHSIQVILVLAMSWAVIKASQERTRHEAARARMAEKVIGAQEEERRRIAYDLHDGIAQLIVSAKQHVDTCRALAGGDPGRAARELGRAAERLQGALTETRRVLAALRPIAVDAVGLAEAMRRALDDAAQAAGWSVRFVDNLGSTRVSAAVETAAFRILQEALVNASRHSRSRTVEVEVAHRRSWLHLEVRDDGVGLAADGQARSGRGLGLAGMRERAELLGGTCRIEGPRGHGTCVIVELPLALGAGDVPAE